MTDNLPELQAAAFDKYAAENINTVFSGRIYSHQAPFYMLLFRAGWDAAIASERARADALQAELDLRRKSGSAVERLHNLCEGIAADADGSEFSREEWDRIDAENLDLRKRADALEAALREIVDRLANNTLFAAESGHWQRARSLLEKTTAAPKE